MGLILGWIATRIPIKFLQQNSIWIMVLGLFLLVIVLVPGIGHVINGSRRWLSFGFFGMEVSEIVKLCAIIYLASYLQRFQDQVKKEFKGFIKPMLILALMVFLLLMEPDFGAASVITLTFFALLFIAGARLWPYLLLLIIGVLAFSTLAVTSPYRMARLTTFLNPWQTAYTSGYQLTQSLIAFGRGGIFGVGLGNSMQKLFYLPEAHTDFVFAVIAEELGLIGELLLIVLYILLVMRIIGVGRRAYNNHQFFAAYLACGIGFWLTLQFIINIGVNTGLLPTKGLTLPFISYGGSSLLINCLVIGVMLRIAYETALSQPVGKITSATYSHLRTHA